MRIHALKLGLRAEHGSEQPLGLEVIEALAEPDQRWMVAEGSQAIHRSNVKPIVRYTYGTNKPEDQFRAEAIHLNTHLTRFARLDLRGHFSLRLATRPQSGFDLRVGDARPGRSS